MRHFLAILLFMPLLQAGLINGIALTVNEEPVTLYEIDAFAQKNNVSKEQATVELMKSILAKQAAKENQLEVKDEQINERIDLIIEKNNLTKETFKQQLALQGLTYETLFEQLKDQMTMQQVVGFITQGKVDMPDAKEKKEFYELHKKEFGLPTRISVTHYQSSNQNSLASIQRSPLFSPSDVQKNSSEIDPTKIDPKLAQLLLSAKQGEFTQIYPMSANLYGMFYIKSVSSFKIPGYDAVSERLGQVMQEKKRTEILNNFFADALRKANIEYLRVNAIPLN